MIGSFNDSLVFIEDARREHGGGAAVRVGGLDPCESCGVWVMVVRFSDGTWMLTQAELDPHTDAWCPVAEHTPARCQVQGR